MVATGKNNSATAGFVLAIGAAGKFAGLVVPELFKRGCKIRGLVRKPEEAEKVRLQGAAEVAVGDLSDEASIERALVGVRSVFYIAPVSLQNEAAVGISVVRAAARAGVQRFVFSSVIDPILSGLANHAQKAPVEEELLISGMEYSILQPTLFFQNFKDSWPQIVQSGVLAEPWSVETRFSRVDYRDVAEVAAIALTEDRLLYGSFELCAEGWHNRTEIAAIISDVIRRPIAAARIDPAKAAAGAGPAASMLEKMFNWYDLRGLRGNSLTLEAILGRAPRTLRAFFEELASASKKAS